MWLVPGIACLCLFAWLLTLVEVEHAGRTYARVRRGLHLRGARLALGGRRGPADRWDLLGASICLAGAAVILWGPRTV